MTERAIEAFVHNHVFAVASALTQTGKNSAVGYAVLSTCTQAKAKIITF